MPINDPAIAALRDALAHSPDNVPLRKHLAETLLSKGHAGDAEQEFRAALKLAPQDLDVQLGLARAFFSGGKDAEATVLVEQLVKRDDAPWSAYVLHARLLIRAGEIQSAIAQYRQAVDMDPDLRDDELEAMLGINASEDDDDVIDGRVRVTGDIDHGSDLPIDVEKPQITFDDVGGMDSLKEEIRMRIIYPLEKPEIFEAYGKKIGGGVLMYGPPGCGKTYLARATAGEIGANFLSVGINDVLDMWLGNSERNLHTIFETARRNRPSVIFFDEVDALGASRSDMRQTSGRHLINQFLAELDGARSSNEGVLVLAATNAPWHMDAAFRRPGRFDRILFVPPPDAVARGEILKLCCDGKPTGAIDYGQLAKKTPHFSGADLGALVDAAIQAKLEKAMRAGVPEPLTTRDLAVAAKRVRPTTKEWFAAARNYALYANEGGAYDEVLQYLKTL